MYTHFDSLTHSCGHFYSHDTEKGLLRRAKDEIKLSIEVSVFILNVCCGNCPVAHKDNYTQIKREKRTHFMS